MQDQRVPRPGLALPHRAVQQGAAQCYLSHCGTKYCLQDPILTAFELSWELRRLAFSEHEFKSEYLVRQKSTTSVQTFSDAKIVQNQNFVLHHNLLYLLQNWGKNIK